MVKFNNTSAKITGTFKVNVGGSGGPVSVVGKYFYTTDSVNNGWWVLGNWWGNSAHTIPATDLPTSTMAVEIKGGVAPLADLDRPDWVQPLSIVSTGVGITFTSAMSSSLTCSITGNATFQGSATFGTPA